MLEQLSIKNYALIEDLHINFDEGFNVLTGETGAGKSIIAGALGLILGERASTGIIRKGAESCTIRASFDIAQNKTLQYLLKEQGLGPDDTILLLCREVSATGKNKCLANDQVITLTTLESIGNCLVDLHGQHEHQSLLQSREQLQILDDFGTLVEQRKEVGLAYTELRQLESELEELFHHDRERDHFIDLYQFQIKEIQAAQLEPGEDETLVQEINLLANAEKIAGLVNDAYQWLYEEEGSTLSRLAKIKQNLLSLQGIDQNLQPTSALLDESIINLEEINSRLREYKDKVVFDPAKLDQLMERKELINRLKNKYGTTVKDMLSYRDKIAKEIEKLSQAEENRAGLVKAIAQAKGKVMEKAKKLSLARQKTALKLEQETAQELKDLGLPKIKFKISLMPEVDSQGKPQLTSTGLEKADYLISPNIGEDLQPLAKIASGGEMSRIMLGLKSVLAHSDQIPTLIFDEIDTGIGGSMAEVVGKKISALSTKHQIVCITHWPQLAGFATTHLHVSKETKGERTYTRIKQLEYEERIKEIARMLGGETLSAISLKHAQELIKSSRQD
ncbi:MAG: DNA repair protein RecN [Elusimicrobia bacterium]|nr:DNA repair protein RecN [Elusimicrobiota bacterium]